MPKFIGPYKILEDYGNNSFKLDLPSELKQRGLHAAFHASLLRIHHLNDDVRFPGRQLPQIIGLGQAQKWVVDKVIDHRGTGEDAMFEVLWSTGDRTWLPFCEASHLTALSNYLEAQGVKTVKGL
ncbi:hypothetical protein DENSPDRAFT_778971, partial [Dentipellis sp. KUC8613]